MNPPAPPRPGAHHPDALQVHLGPAQLLPAVMAVAAALGDAAEVARQLKDVPHQGAAAHLVRGDLSSMGGRGTCGVIGAPRGL